MNTGSILIKSDGHDWRKVQAHYDAVGVKYEEWEVDTVKKHVPRAMINEREMDFGASEDFSLLMKDVAARGGRSLYWGMGVSRGVNTGLHSPRFDVEEDCLVTAAAVMASALFSPMDKKG